MPSSWLDYRLGTIFSRLFLSNDGETLATNSAPFVLNPFRHKTHEDSDLPIVGPSAWVYAGYGCSAPTWFGCVHETALSTPKHHR